ncbi:MAG: HEAT repeat domain-containing protein, partial [Verrucomicrobia bacterium]|nr:HEAT repeat domain-containing protein [Verrucomicrobiota bacterium]
MTAKKKKPESTARRLLPPLDVMLTPAALEEWTRLTRTLPLNTGPRLLFVLVDSPKLRRRLADHLAAGLGAKGHTVATLELTSPKASPLQGAFDLAERRPEAHFLFLHGLGLSLNSSETRLSAIADLNLHRDQIPKRLAVPLILWISDEVFTDLARHAPDFTAWQAGVFTLAATDETSAPTHLPSGVVTAMFTDIVNSTRLKNLMEGETSGRRDAAFRARIKGPHDKIVLACVEEADGHLVNPTGDGFCFSFHDAEEAILCALKIQDQLTARPIQTPEGRLLVRIGLHTGIADPSGGDYIASTIDKAARVQSKAEPGQVAVSRETHALASGKLRGVGFERVGEFDLKGLGTEEIFRAFLTTEDPARAAENAYRRHLIDRFGKMTLYSITSDAPLSVDLERVFVRLTTIEKQKHAMPPFGRAMENLDDDELGFRFGEPGSRLPSRRSVQLMRGRPAPFPARPLTDAPVIEETTVTLSLNEAVRRHASMAVIGAPGSGKTTLLQYLALTFARHQTKERLELEEDRLPVLVALRDYNRFLENLRTRGELQEPGASLLPRFLTEHVKSAAPHLALPDGFFARALAKGGCAVFLDGLDEIADPIQRGRIAEAVANVVQQYSANRFIVTSRPRGYESEARQRLSPMCAECTIRDFDEKDRTAFAQAWYEAVVTQRKGGTPTAREEARAAAADLLRAIQADPRITALASNPLLLSVLAMVHQRGTTLPQRRVELYEECIDLFLGYWDQVKGESARELARLGGLTRGEKRALLEPVALWLHERGESGMQVDQKELEDAIAGQFRELFGDPEPQSRRRAKLFLEVITERTGLIVERETGVYAFAHLTFQEYLAARALADRPDYIPYTLARLHDPWWREVILLEVGHLATPNTRRSREQTTNLLKAIRNAGSWLEDVLKRDLLLAGRAVSDVGALGVEKDFRQSLCSELLALWQQSRYEPQRKELIDLFAYAMPTSDGPMILDKLLALSQDANDDVRRAAADALGRLGAAAATEKTLGALVALSQDANDDVRSAAAYALGRLG